jgi:hypothetical protein
MQISESAAGEPSSMLKWNMVLVKKRGSAHCQMSHEVLDACSLTKKRCNFEHEMYGTDLNTRSRPWEGRKLIPTPQISAFPPIVGKSASLAALLSKRHPLSKQHDSPTTCIDLF